MTRCRARFHHRPQKSPISSAPGPPAPTEAPLLLRAMLHQITANNKNQRGKEEWSQPEPAGGHHFNNITGKQLHVGWTHAHVGGKKTKTNGPLVVTLPVKTAAPTCVLTSDNPENMFGVSFPTRCSTQLAEVYSYSGRCPSPWFRSFFCVSSQVDERHLNRLPVGDFHYKRGNQNLQRIFKQHE